MAYSDIGDFAPDDVLTAADMDQIRENFQAGVPDIFTTKGDLAGATGANAAARLAVGANDATLVPDSGEATGMIWQTQPAARVYNSGNIDPAVGSWVTLTFDSERIDTDTVHNPAVNPSRLTVPTGGAGLYLIGGNVAFEVGTGDKGIRILLGGATVIAQSFGNATSDDGDVLSVTTLYSLAATNYVELQVFVEADLNILASANYSPEFWAIWQRRA